MVALDPGRRAMPFGVRRSLDNVQRSETRRETPVARTLAFKSAFLGFSPLSRLLNDEKGNDRK